MIRMINFDEALEKLFVYFGVFTITELAEEMGVTRSIVSAWKQRKSINPVKKRCMEMGIYDEIFGNHINTIQTSNDVAAGGSIDLIHSADKVFNIKGESVLLSAKEQFLIHLCRTAEAEGNEDDFLMWILLWEIDKKNKSEVSETEK